MPSLFPPERCLVILLPSFALDSRTCGTGHPVPGPSREVGHLGQFPEGATGAALELVSETGREAVGTRRPTDPVPSSRFAEHFAPPSWVHYHDPVSSVSDWSRRPFHERLFPAVILRSGTESDQIPVRAAFLAT